MNNVYLHTIQQNRAEVSYNDSRIKSKIIIGVAVGAISLLLFGVAIIGSNFFPITWLNCTLIGLGTAGFTVICVGGVWKVYSLVKEDSERAGENQAPSNRITPSNRNIPTVSSLIDVELPQNVIPSEVLSLIFFNLEHPTDLFHASLACKHWYSAVNNETSPTKSLLDQAFGNGFPLHRQVDEQILQIFSLNDLWKIPTVPEDWKLNVYSTQSFKNFIGYFEEKKSSFLKGQDSSGNWLFFIRCKWKLAEYVRNARGPSKPGEGDTLVTISKNKDGEWIARGGSLPKAFPAVLSLRGVLLNHHFSNADSMKEKNVLEWIKSLLNGYTCGPLSTPGSNLNQYTQDILSVNLWRPEDRELSDGSGINISRQS